MATINRKRLSSSSTSYQPVLTPNKDNKASNASDSWYRKNKEIVLCFRSADLRKSTFQDICNKAAELEAYHRHPNSDRNEVKVQKDVRRSIVEEMRKQNQATLATILARNTARRLLGDKKPGTEGVLESGRKIVPEEKYETERALLRLPGDRWVTKRQIQKLYLSLRAILYLKSVSLGHKMVLTI
ncbi:uncharacterized protein LOC113291808 [Papaver somniferum]|uniref:uncharacterized protein LOC113291808 n=1 Tax=Papaver somniferum TaxID=3469 RepID=UPI000E6FEDBE|nr:uncharacterized protein LOC113291808 [Papaver somniferum]